MEKVESERPTSTCVEERDGSTDTTEVGEIDHEDGEVFDSSNTNQNVTAGDEGEITDEEETVVVDSATNHKSEPKHSKAGDEPMVRRISSLEKLKNMKFGPKSKFNDISSREVKGREKRERLGSTVVEDEPKRARYSAYASSSDTRITSSRRDVEEERRIRRKRQWEEYDDNRPIASRSWTGQERPRPLRDAFSPPFARSIEAVRPVDQPSTLRQRIEQFISVPDVEMMNWSDVELRRQLIKLIELDKEHRRIYNGRRQQILAMCDLYWSTRNDVERLLDSMQPHQRSDVLPLPPPLQMSQLKSFGTEGGQLQAAFTTVRPLLNVSNGHDNSINSSMSQLSSEFGRSTRNVSSQIRSNSPVRPSFPAAPSMLSGPPPFVVNGTSAHSQPVSAAIPPNMNIPPPSTARMSSSSTTYGAPVVGSVQPPPFSRPPPLENLASTSVVPPNLSQPPPIVTRTSSGTLPPPDFSIPPPSTSAMSIPPPTSLISSTSGTASDALTVSMSTTVSVVSSKPLVSNSTLPTTSTSTLPSIEPATSSANPSAKNLPPTINLSVPPPSFNIPPPRVTVSTFSTPPPTVDTHTSLAPHTSRPPPGPPPSLLMRPPPNLSVGAPPPLNLSIPPPPLSHNLSGPPPPLNLSCPPPAIRPTVLNSTSVSNAPPNVQQVLSAIVNQSAQSGQTPAEVVNEIIAATSYAPQQPRSSLNVSSSRSPVPASASIRSSPNSAAMQQTATTRIRIGPGGSTTLTSSLVGGPPSHITTPPTLPSSVANKVHTVSLSSTATSSSPVIPGSNSFRFMGCTSSQSGRYPFHLSPTCQPQQQQQTSSHRQLDTVPLVRDDSEGNQEESAGRPLNSDFIGMVARGPQRM